MNSCIVVIYIFMKTFDQFLSERIVEVPDGWNPPKKVIVSKSPPYESIKHLQQSLEYLGSGLYDNRAYQELKNALQTLGDEYRAGMLHELIRNWENLDRQTKINSLQLAIRELSPGQTTPYTKER